MLAGEPYLILLEIDASWRTIPDCSFNSLLISELKSLIPASKEATFLAVSFPFFSPTHKANLINIIICESAALVETTEISGPESW